tara:strand:- start:124441 stop:124899 length:459 start_codon:yes stop_codon:yes gene_type:complete
MSRILFTGPVSLPSGVYSLLLFGLMFAGCSSNAPPYSTAAVQGKVFAPNGELLTEGEVTFTAPEMGVGATMPITAEGTFVVPADIRVGKYIVTVTPPPIPPMDPGATKSSLPDPKRFDTLIPKVYRKELTTPLKDYEVKQGDNNFEIKLQSP